MISKRSEIILTLGLILLAGKMLKAITVECPVFSLKDFPKVPNKKGSGNYWNDDEGDISVSYAGIIQGVQWTGWVNQAGKKAITMTSIAPVNAVVDNGGRPVCRYAINFDNQEPALLMNVSQNLSNPENKEIFNTCGILGKTTFDCSKGPVDNSEEGGPYY
ncbi:MAG: hypothetical protein BGO67_11150 [Alphaproteobacteria bacterium 41-28]|nr:MAG: hypothetical protein BGO67_11150 [Alphaproteobacteria bacterium 41-28]